jgi:glycosyltransferase involved in cell wall biosynthesis
MACQLEKNHCLKRLITTYPKFAAARFGVGRDKVVSLPHIEVANRVAGRAVNKKYFNYQYLLHELYDIHSSRFVPRGIDVFVGWSGLSERGLARARRAGAVAVVERGSTHVEHQRDVLKEEYDRHGLEPQLPHPGVVDKELREYELSDYVSIPSEFVRRTFLARGFPGEKLIKNPYGVSLKSFRPSPRVDDKFRVLFVGGMALRKGVHYLLEAFAGLRLRDAELWLVGGMNPEVEPFFKKYEGTFRHFAPVPQSELHWHYSQCSVFALCSVEEGLAMVQAQAMACGLPLICTPNTGCEELITDGVEGFVVPARGVEAIREKIQLLYDDRDRCRGMGAAARARVERGLTWDDYGNRMIVNLENKLNNKYGLCAGAAGPPAHPGLNSD